MTSRYGTPPPLHAPVPSKPSYIPDPPSTPGSPDGYQRYSSEQSSPPAQNVPLQQPAYPFFNPQLQQQFHHPQQQQQQQHGMRAGSMQGGPVPGNTAFGNVANAWGVNDVTAQFGMQLGQSAVAAGQDYVQKNFGVVALSTAPLKHHFNVSNSYVLRKLQLVLFPWRHKPWARRQRPVDPNNPGGATEWEPPREDLNSPDLYIPVMSLVTYVLMAALYAGLKGAFHPSEFSTAASRAVGVLLLDVAILWFASYLAAAPTSFPLVESLAWAGYKFVGVNLTLALGLVTSNRLISSTVFFYVFAANAFFLLRGLRPLLLPDAASAAFTGAGAHTGGGQQRQRRIGFLFLEAVIQLLYMYALVRI